MEIGIIVAMSKELDLLLQLLDNTSVFEAEGVKYHMGKLHGHHIVAMQCGIGKVNAAVGAIQLIDKFHPGLIINTGVAGGTGAGAKILDVVLGNRVAYHDVWCGPRTLWGQVEGMPRYFEGAKIVTEMDCVKNMSHIKCGLIATGDMFVSRVEEVERIKALYPDVLAVDMESAAIAQVCHLKNVDFVSLRVVSDTPGAAENIAQYDNFWEDAPRNSFDVLRTILSNL